MYLRNIFIVIYSLYINSFTKRNKRTFPAAWRMNLHMIRSTKNLFPTFQNRERPASRAHEFRSNGFGQWAETATGFQVHNERNA